MIIKKELLIFDLDGTLIDSAPDLALALNDMLSQLGRENFSEALIRSWVGNGAQTLVKRGLSGRSEIDRDIDEILFEKALSIFLKSYADNACVSTALYPNVYETIYALKEQGYKMAIVTNKPFAFIAPILTGLDLMDVFDLCLGGDTLEKKKPEPEPLFYACNYFDIDIKSSLMIGDSKNDIIAAKAAKMQSVGVSYGYNYGEDIALENPDFVVNDFAQILDIVEYDDGKK